jgi:endonuclease/exonuclease/phosphatase family metal-dependent hydrolase
MRTNPRGPGRWIPFLLLSLAAGCIPAPFVTGEADLARGQYAPSTRAFGDSIIVASYNIRFGEKVDEAIEDLRREPHLARADVLLLQEMDPSGCDRIARELGYNHVYYPAAIHPHGDRLFGNAILTRGEIRGQDFIDLAKHGILTGTNRIAVVARIRFGRLWLRAVGIHTSTPLVPLEQRVQQVRTLLDSLSSARCPTVVGGDFNTTTRSSLLLVSREMQCAGYRRMVLPGDTTTRADRRNGSRKKDVLDHIFYRVLSPRASGVFTGATASVHYPVRSVFGWPLEPR